jgi:hypothetical protein
MSYTPLIKKGKLMSISLADYHEIPEEVFAATGALDPILDQDTRLFIDPTYLRLTTVPELASSYNNVLQYFEDILHVVRRIKTRGDVFWRSADIRLTFPEVKGLCIGYSTSGTSGSGMGSALRAQLLATIIDIVQAGVDDPRIFELVGIFETDIGPDRISDMTAKIIIDALIEYTQRVCDECGIPMELQQVSRDIPEAYLPINPLTKTPLILVPKQVLNDLPVAERYSDIERIASRNASIRAELNRMIGGAWSKVSTSEKKDIIKRTCIQHPEILREILDEYRKAQPNFYDFGTDPSGEVVWYSTAKRIVQTEKLDLKLSAQPTVEEVEGVVSTICEQFKHLIEDGQLCDLLYDTNGGRKHESAAQKLFYGIAHQYCKANNLDLSPEANSGRGPVDFKVSRGFDAKVLVELKLTSNPQLFHGFEKQLQAYQEAEGTLTSFYLVIDNGGASVARLDKFQQVVRDTAPPAPRVIMVDGVSRPSASRA